MRRLLAPVFVLMGLSLSAVPCLAAEERPNILLIVVDDMGYSDVGCFGGEIRTPNIDALAQSGVRFTNYYTAPTCSPTRSMLMSGMDNHLVGFGNQKEVRAPNQVGKPGYEGYLNDRCVSFAAVLREAGYHTYMAGKWHLGEEPERDPFHRGFEKSFCLLQGGASHFDDEWMMCANYTPVYRENGTRVHVPRGFYSTKSYTDKIIEWTRAQQDDKPFFAYLAYTAPHDPLHVPDEWLDKYKGTYDEGYDALREKRLARLKALGLIGSDAVGSPGLPMVPAWDTLTPEQKKTEARKMEIYAAMVDNVDHHVGRLVAHLRKIGKFENTLVLFFSDNGANGSPMHGYPGTDEAWVERNSDNRFENYGRRGSRIDMGMGWAQASSTPFRLFKGFIAEGGIRTPLIVSGPGVARRGHVSPATAHVTDVAPTLLDVAGATHPRTWRGRDVLPMQGTSLAPYLAGKADTVRSPDEPIGWELLGWRAMRLGDWKATWISRPFGPSEWQLFDLGADPGETRDLADEQPAKLHELVNHWERYAEQNRLVLPDSTFEFGR